MEDERHRLDLVLAPTNHEELSSRKVLESTSQKEQLESTSKYEKKTQKFIDKNWIKD